MIGTGATPKHEINYTDMFKRLAYVGDLFRVAEEVATTDRPLLNANARNYDMAMKEARVHAFSDVPVSAGHQLVLAVGSKETGFYQVPIIQLAGGTGEEGIDVMVSGTIDEKGAAESFGKPKKLSEYATEAYNGQGIEKAQRVYAVALVPKTDVIGQDVLIGGKGKSGMGIYHMILNGFSLDRKVVGSSGSGYMALVTGEDSFAPMMFPQKDGERYLKLGDILGQEQLAEAAAEGLTPGLTFVAGQFRQEIPTPRFAMRSFSDLSLGGGDMMRSMGGATRGGGATYGDGATKDGDAGRVGLEIGSESDVRYNTIRGSITSIEGVLALHFIGVEDGAEVAKVRDEVKKLAS